MAEFQYRVRAFPEQSIEDIEADVNALAEDGWRVIAAGNYFNSHVVYLEKKNPPPEVDPPA